MADIPFTQFLRPNGRRRHTTINRPEDVANKAMAVIEAGGLFTVEELMTGHASIACEYEDDDIAIEIVPNGPQVPNAVDKVVESAHKHVFKSES